MSLISKIIDYYKWLFGKLSENKMALPGSKATSLLSGIESRLEKATASPTSKPAPAPASVPEPAPQPAPTEAAKTISADKICAKNGVTIRTEGSVDTAPGNFTAWNMVPKYIYVTENGSTKRYKFCGPGKSTSLIKKAAASVGFAVKSSWGKDMLSKELIRAYNPDMRQPERGKSCDFFNVAVIGGLLIVHRYTNDGIGFADSIKQAGYAYLAD